MRFSFDTGQKFPYNKMVIFQQFRGGREKMRYIRRLVCLLAVLLLAMAGAQAEGKVIPAEEA